MANETLSERIQRLRKRAGLSIPKVAELCTKLGSEVSRQSVSKWESGETKNLKLSNLYAFAQVVGATIEEVISGPTGMAPEDPYPSSGQKPANVVTASERRPPDEIDAAANLIRTMEKADRDACLQLIRALSAKYSQGAEQSRRQS